MNLIPDADKAAYSAVVDDLHDTFARDIIAIKETKTPTEALSDANDDYDFINKKNVGSEEFTYSLIQTTVKARVKYIDRQEIDNAFLASIGGDNINLKQEFGLIRIKVALADGQVILDASRIMVDGNNTNILFRDTPHGLFSSQYDTFYLQRTP